MSLKLRRKTYWFRQWVPEDLRSRYGGRRHIERSLQTSDRKEAERRDKVLSALYLDEFEKMRRGNDPTTPATLRAAYLAALREGTSGAVKAFGFTEGPSGALESVPPDIAGIELEIEKLVDTASDLRPEAEARLAGLQDARRTLQGSRPKPRGEYEAPFSEMTAEYMRHWKAAATRKASNTKQQKEATFSLFARYWNDRPIRGVQEADAAAFHDALRLLDPSWPRTETGRSLPWPELVARFGNRPKGLSQATLNRHMAALKSLWTWCAKRGHCGGFNPFDDFHVKLKFGANHNPYVAWEDEELKKLLSPPPTRQELKELILVGMFSGARIDEIASLKWGQLRKEGTVWFFDITDAKTPAGTRAVPVHASLDWLLKRKRGADSASIWPGWNLEGPGKRAGSDASREFSRFKAQRGFAGQRTKAFHSFRKNVTRMMERAGVLENEWAQVFGHERGFTYARYNQDGITMQQRARLIKKIAYPGITLPEVQP